MTYGMVPKMDRDFWTDKKCNGCGICGRVCPVGNIAFESGKPVVAAPVRAVPGLHPVVPPGGDPVREEDARRTSAIITRK